LTTVVSRAVWFLLEEGRFDAVEEFPAFTLLFTVMLGICIRQQAGMLAARIELSREAK
jgi:p-aminobenzoyl-glutamate transporter AbgT